ncbi:MAG: quinoprotein dehydrogenase-associated SoxYZ-like carrier [Pseudomonadota bacterium]
MLVRSLSVLATLFWAQGAMALEGPQTPLEDPMRSGMWDYLQVELLEDPADIQFDSRIKLSAPVSADDSSSVPLLVDATAIDDVARIIVSADYGPFPQILTYYPEHSEPKIALRFKIDQATAIRASVQTKDGRWHIGSTYVDAAGGGCSVPAQAYADADWEEKLGEIHGKIWAASSRARVVIDHPMDTGLANNIPVFIVQHLDFEDPDGERLARIELHEPVSEDPAFSLYFEDGTMPVSMTVSGRDNNGNTFEGLLSSDTVTH